MQPSNLPKTTTPGQKVVAIGLLIAAIFGGIWVFNNYLASFFIDFFENVIKLVFIGTPVLLATLYVISNPLFIWGFFTTLSRKFTQFWIKMDPLSVMDRYVEWLAKKLANLSRSIEILMGKQTKLDRKLEGLERDRKEYLRLGEAALKQGQTRAASLNGGKAASLKNSIAILMPLKQRTDMAIEKMSMIQENWSYSLEKTKFEITNKRDEYEMIREVVKGLKSADDFINSDNEAARNYGYSLKALEETVTQGMGFVEDFDRRSKDIINNISIEKQANQDDGLKELEAYIQQSNLLLPTSFDSTAGVQGAEVVKKFNL